MAQQAESPAPDDDATPAVGKGRPTPTRAEREAANRRPLAPDTKEARKAARAKLAEQRRRANEGMANGEEKFLPVRDRGPQRRFARDYTDAGWHLGEAVLPVLLVAVVMMMMPATDATFAIPYYAFAGVIIVMLFVIADMIFLSRKIKKQLRAKFGDDRLERGLGWYVSMRSMQMRFMRLPKPQVKRGQYPTL